MFTLILAIIEVKTKVDFSGVYFATFIIDVCLIDAVF